MCIFNCIDENQHSKWFSSDTGNFLYRYRVAYVQLSICMNLIYAQIQGGFRLYFTLYVFIQDTSVCDNTHAGFAYQEKV